MAGPRLKLVMLQGPREGESLEFRPGSTIRIGRVVRGNNVPIKDGGISTKHLSIVSESGKWVVRDLDSSNGTILNETTKVSPNTPFELRDGDSLKIGECTSILVKIDGHDDSRQRRNPGRRIAEKGAENRDRGARVLNESELVESEKSEVVLVVENQRPRLRKARVLKNADTEELKIEENLGIQRELENVGPVEAKAAPRISPRRTRSKKNQENLVSNSLIGKNLDGSRLGYGEVMIESKRRRGHTRRMNLQEEQADCVQISKDKGNADITEDRENLEELKGCDKVENRVAYGVKDGAAADEAKSLDLEKTTLGDWFKYLQIRLSKQIVDETEEIIENMKQKAKRVHEFMVQQKNEKFKQPLG